jgi:hypothetical protein
MKQLARSALSPLSPLPITLVAAACGGFDRDAATMPAQDQAPPRSAGNVGLGIAPDRPQAELDALRARGREALADLLATYDAATDPAKRAALAATIDKVAGQRYATVSRLYWYTDLDAARAESRGTGKPILSLRMLGRLDEDLSCANSRFFRTVLYPDPSVAAMLRDKFVLHWSSERAVPRVTIDFGDGRALERTVTGNSIHYVLDSDGRPVDALPGMYAPSVFRAELDRSLELYRELAGTADPAVRARKVAAYHAVRIEETSAQWSSLGGAIYLDTGRTQVLRGAALTSALAKAQRATMSKAMVEAPELARIDIGPDPGALLPDIDTWTMIGMAVYGFGVDEDGKAGKSGKAGKGNAAAAEVADQYYVGGQVVAARRKPAARAARPELGVLSPAARLLVAEVMRLDSAARTSEVIAELERSVIADTAINQMQIRGEIHGWMARTTAPRPDGRTAVAGALPTFDQLDRYVYDELFETPADDPWLGLLPRDVYTGLPGDGVVTR